MVDRRYSVLVADPNTRCREALRDILEPEGYEVVSAESGREAIDIVHAEPIHLVVMEVQLPDYSGFEVYHAIKDIRDTFLPCIFTAVQMAVGAIRDALAEDAVTILPKPVETPRLTRAVDWSIRRYYRSDNRFRPDGLD